MKNVAQSSSVKGFAIKENPAGQQPGFSVI
jgi:hypothetical protein